jgi:hypothetical protein
VSSLAGEPVKAAFDNPDIRTIQIGVATDNGQRTIVSNIPIFEIRCSTP